jgi:uncharacterized phiE125 gp8 family phage protein
MSLEQLTMPGVTPISLAEAKAHSRVDVADDDALILGYIRSATQAAEALLNRSLITRTLKYSLDAWCDVIALPMPPALSVTSIKYDDDAGAEQTLATSVYEVSVARQPALVIRAPSQSWPSLDSGTALDRVRIEYQAGYGPDPTDVPEQIRQGILFLAAHLYQERQPVVVGAAVNAIPMTAEHLLLPYRNPAGI